MGPTYYTCTHLLTRLLTHSHTHVLTHFSDLLTSKYLLACFLACSLRSWHVEPQSSSPLLSSALSSTRQEVADGRKSYVQAD